jgi:hypothetical protein
VAGRCCMGGRLFRGKTGCRRGAGADIGPAPGLVLAPAKQTGVFHAWFFARACGFFGVWVWFFWVCGCRVCGCPALVPLSAVCQCIRQCTVVMN